jgi:putative ABC transport system permease protein
MNPGVRPPRLAQFLVERCAPRPVREHLLGDLDEQFLATVSNLGITAARRRYWRQAAAALWHWPLGPGPGPQPHAKEREPSMFAVFDDARFAIRQLLRQPSYLAIAVLSLALAIAANGLVFGLVNNLILNPFNYPDAKRLISIGGAFPTLGGERNFVEQFSPPEVLDFTTIPVIEKLGAFDLGNRVLAHGESADRVFTAFVMRDPLPALGQPMALGRSFTAEELAPGGPKVALISHRVWQRVFGGDPDVIGKPVRVNTDVTTLIGVMGPGALLLGTDLWIPWGADPALAPRTHRLFTVVARLKKGASLEDMDNALATVSARAKSTLVSEHPEYADWQLSAAPWTTAVTGELLPAGALLLVAGGVVLLVACVNLASLLLARLANREREFAVRRALGASGWRITRLLIFESAIVAALAAGAGIALSNAGLAAIPGLLPDQVLQFGFELAMDKAVVAYCILAAVLAATLTAIFPAWHMRRAVAPALAQANRAAAGPARQRGRRALIVTEVALAVVLLVNAGLFLRSYGRIAQINPGFDPAGLLTMRLTIDSRLYPGEAAAAFFTNLIDRLQALPGVIGATAVNQLPTAAFMETNFTVEGLSVEGSSKPSAFLTVGSPQLFTVLRTPMRSGRALTDRDRTGAPTVAVVNQAFSRRYLNGGTAGKLRIGERAIPVDVVGVVADASNQSLVGAVRPEIFATMAQGGQGNNQYFLMIRTQGEPMSLLPEVRRTLAAQDPNQPVYMVNTMNELMETGVFPQRVAMVTVGIFGLGALLVAVVGVYGLISHWVVSRTREIGIRLALGGSTQQVTGLVLGQVARLIGVATLIGLAGGVGAATFAAPLLFATTPTDPWTLIAVIGVLVVAGGSAALLPARRAARVNPVEALRAE